MWCRMFVLAERLEHGLRRRCAAWLWHLAIQGREETAKSCQCAARTGVEQQQAQPGVLDPSNNMPREPNQRPWAGQRAPLSTERTKSSIPKGGTQDSWLYPSPQMFYNGEHFAGKRASTLIFMSEHLQSAVDMLWRQLIKFELLPGEVTCAVAGLSRTCSMHTELLSMNRSSGRLQASDCLAACACLRHAWPARSLKVAAHQPQLLHCCAALMRKGKGEDVIEQDMDSVVHAHNCESAPVAHLHRLQINRSRERAASATRPCHAVLCGVACTVGSSSMQHLRLEPQLFLCELSSLPVLSAAMNERTWDRVAEWERLHCDACPDPRLLRFQGRPDDLRSVSIGLVVRTLVASWLAAVAADAARVLVCEHASCGCHVPVLPIFCHT